jgi:putative two-component system response regulator
MKTHTIIGEEIVKPLRTLANVCPIIRAHHERWNGTGYPDKLKGEEIPYLARLFQILDAYDALTTARHYKKALSGAEAADVLRDEAARGLWDPAIMDAFLRFTSSR